MIILSKIFIAKHLKNRYNCFIGITMSNYTTFTIPCIFAGFSEYPSDKTEYDAIADIARRIFQFFTVDIPDGARRVFHRITAPAIPPNKESDMLIKEDLTGYANPGKESYTQHFLSFNQVVAFPYSIQGHTTPAKIFHHYTGNKTREEFKALMESGDRKALHTSAIMKLLGDKNTVATSTITTQLMQNGIYLDPTPVRAGQIEILSGQVGDGEFKFRVVNEVVQLNTGARYTTTRTVTVTPPTDEGTVHYSIERSFTASL
jgi:hypothetical protein